MQNTYVYKSEVHPVAQAWNHLKTPAPTPTTRQL